LSTHWFSEDKGITAGTIGFSSVQRRFVLLSLNEPVEVTPFKTESQSIYINRYCQVITLVKFEQRHLWSRLFVKEQKGRWF
jgi:hypothetical protein